MSIWDSLLGHDQVVEQVRRAVDRNRLSHAYLLSGPAGIGKGQFSRRLAQSLFCEHIPDSELDACGSCPNCKRFQAGVHPDFFYVSCPPEKKSIPIELFVGDDDHRGRAGLCYELSLKPMASDRKIAIIDDAHLMQNEASNSLLKTLEEPPENSLILLITDREEAILPTIRSRCQTIRFQNLSQDHMTQLVLDYHFSENETEARSLASLADGSLETARELSAGPIRELLELLGKGLTSSQIHPLQQAPRVLEWLESAGESYQQRQAAFWLLKFIGEEQLRILRAENQDATSVDLTDRNLSRIREAEQQLHEMMPLPLWLEGLLYDLAAAQRA